jgi:hypothetical protein
LQDEPEESPGVGRYDFRPFHSESQSGHWRSESLRPDQRTGRSIRQTHPLKACPTAEQQTAPRHNRMLEFSYASAHRINSICASQRCVAFLHGFVWAGVSACDGSFLTDSSRKATTSPCNGVLEMQFVYNTCVFSSEAGLDGPDQRAARKAELCGLRSLRLRY